MWCLDALHMLELGQDQMPACIRIRVGSILLGAGRVYATQSLWPGAAVGQGAGTLMGGGPITTGQGRLSGAAVLGRKAALSTCRRSQPGPSFRQIKQVAYCL